MEIGIRDECGRRLHAVGLGSRHFRRTRGGAPSALCRDDEGKGRSPSDGPATLLHARSAFTGRPPRLCIENALHPRKAARTIRAHKLAVSPFGGHCAEPKSRSTNRHRGARTRDVALDRPMRRPARGNCSHREVESLKNIAEVIAAEIAGRMYADRDRKAPAETPGFLLPSART